MIFITDINYFYRSRSPIGARYLLATLFLLVSTILSSPALAGDEVSLTSGQIVERLQRGGLVVYFRHAHTDRSHEDQHPVDTKRCETQRNLSELGRKQAAEIGAAFKRLAIPVANVFSSPFCRCKDTAEIAFGNFEINDKLYFAVALTREERAAQTKVLQSMIVDIPASGNRIIVSHTGNLREATGLWPKPEGAAYVFEPQNNGRYRVLGLIAPEEWSELSQ